VPRWPDEPIETGRLAEPKFVHGFDPEKYQWRPPPRPSPWKRHFELGRLHPRQWMLVSEIKKGGPRARRARINSDRQSILTYADLHWPLERWQVRTVTLAGTWCDKELYMRFLGELTPEEDALDRKQRREDYEAKQAKAAENKRRRAQEAREKAAREELEARTKIRQRRNN
jgi:hypothetical protein